MFFTNFRGVVLVRAIFIGDGAAGKTSLIRTLHGEAVVVGKEPMTPGIAIREWLVPKTEIKARLWDFGGQVMSHSTHQFFLRTRCLYILLLDARAEINANDQAEYWLEHVKAFGKDAPVMLVGNKCDLTRINLNMRALKEKYPNIIDYFPISCTLAKTTHKPQFEIFLREFEQQLQKIGTHQVEFTEGQFSVLEAVRERSPKKAFLAHAEFDALCDQHAIGRKGELTKTDFLGLLDHLGEVIYFPELAMQDCYLLNPRWLTYGVYALLYSEKVEVGKGELSEVEVVDILRSKRVEDEHGNVLDYPVDKCRFIVDAMEQFKLCYRLPEDRKRLIIPDKLPSEQPALNFDRDRPGTLAFEFVFRGFLPRHVMPTLIVARHEEIADRQVWQHGVVLHNAVLQARARVQVDYHDRVLQLWVQGAGARELMAILMDDVRKILKRMEALEVDEVVILPLKALFGSDLRASFGEPLERADYQQLLAMYRRKDAVFVSKSGREYDLEKVMGIMMTKKKQQEEKTVINNMFNAPLGTYFHGNNSGDVQGSVMINQQINEAAQEITQKVDQLTPELLTCEGDATEKVLAMQELQQLKQLLADIENQPAEKIKKLGGMLSSIKTHTSGAFSLAKKMKDGEPTMTWIYEKALVLNGLLAAAGLLG